MKKSISNKINGIFFPLINKEILILGYAPKFWQYYFFGILPLILLGYFLDVVLILLVLYFFIGFILASLGYKNQIELEKGKKFYAQEKRFFKQIKGRKIEIKVKDY